jgi:hypothetical protein
LAHQERNWRQFDIRRIRVGSTQQQPNVLQRRSPRCPQNPPGSGPWGFDPPSRHQASNPCRKRVPAISAPSEFERSGWSRYSHVTSRSPESGALQRKANWSDTFRKCFASARIRPRYIGPATGWLHQATLSSTCWSLRTCVSAACPTVSSEVTCHLRKLRALCGVPVLIFLSRLPD